MKKKLLAVICTLVLVATLGIGCAGADGKTGAIGPSGFDGEPGIQGEVGPQGEAGPTGATGASGTEGEQGIQGEIGPEGEEGPRGATGIRGATGPSGSDTECLAQIAVLEDTIATLHRPQIEGISQLVLSTNTPNILTGTVEIVFDFYDAGDDLRDLMLDWCFEPYTQERKAQTNFLATPDMGIDAPVLAAMAQVGLVPSYDVGEQKWTLSLNTNATMTQAIFDTGIFGWVVAVGDPVFPAGRYDWYIEVRDLADNKWGDMMSPPEYAHYVCYFHSEP